MTHPALAAQWQQPDATQYAALSFLARYRGDTLRAYTQDLRAFLGWCAEQAVEPLQAQRPHLELYLRWMEQRGLAPATIGRRFTTVAGFYRYSVIDGHCDKDPSLAVTRPRVPWEGQRRTVLHPLEYAALLTAARRDGPGSHALVALLGMVGLRVSKRGNAVLMSREDYDALQETAYLLRVPANARRLLESLEQARQGQREEHDLPAS